MKDITPILRSLGLLDSEIKTYLSALEHGPQTVIDLSKKTKLSRQATYVAIEALTERGIMSSVTHGKKRVYTAEHPSKLVAYAKRQQAALTEQVEDLERALPELELQTGGERPIVKVFEGKEGIRAVLTELVDANAYSTKIDEITDLDALYALLDLGDLKPYRTQTNKSPARIRSLQSGTVKSPPAKNINRLELPKEFAGFKANISIHQKHIYMVTFEGKVVSVLIESPTLAKTLHLLYDLAFAEAERRFKKRA